MMPSYARTTPRYAGTMSYNAWLSRDGELTRDYSEMTSYDVQLCKDDGVTMSGYA